jgi:hypothetical protein
MTRGVHFIAPPDSFKVAKSALLLSVILGLDHFVCVPSSSSSSSWSMFSRHAANNNGPHALIAVVELGPHNPPNILVLDWPMVVGGRLVAPHLSDFGFPCITLICKHKANLSMVVVSAGHPPERAVLASGRPATLERVPLLCCHI